MDIPQVKFSSVTPLPRHDITEPGRRAAAFQSSSTIVGDALAKMTKTAMEMYKVYNQRTLEEDLNTFDVDSSTSEADWKAKFAGRSTFTQDEIQPFIQNAEQSGAKISTTETYVTDAGELATRPREDIPAHEIYPTMYKDFMLKNLQAHAAKITNTRARERVIAMKTKAINSEYERLTISAARQQHEFMRDSLKSNVANLIDAGNYKLAAKLTRDSTVISKGEREAQLARIDEIEESDTYEQLTVSQDVNGMRSAIEFLRQSEDDYRKGGGALEPPARRKFANQLQSDLNSILQVSKERQNAHRSVLRQKVRDLITANQKGIRTAPQYINELRKGLTAIGDESDAYLIERLDASSEFAGVFQQLQRVDGVTGERIIDEAAKTMESVVRNPVLQATFAYDLNKANRDKIVAVNNDAVAHGKEHLGLPEFDIDNMEHSLMIARQTGPLISEVFKVAPQYLSRSDWATLKNRYDQVNENSKLNILQTINTIFGDDTTAFLKDGMKKDAGIMTQVGELVRENLQGARLVLRGQSLMAERTVDLSTVDQNLNIELRKKLSTMYPDRQMFDQKLEAAKAAYVATIWERDGGVSQESVDTEVVDKVLGLVTKGSIEFNGRIVEAPERGVTSHSFRQHVNDLSYRHFEELGGFEGISEKKVVREIRDGALSFRSLGDGKYVIANDMDQPVFSAKTKTPFVFDWFASPFTLAMQKAEEDAQLVEKWGDAAVVFKKERKRNAETRQLYGFSSEGGSPFKNFWKGTPWEDKE